MFDAALEQAPALGNDCLERIVAVFHDKFLASHHTELVPGASEPLYLPASPGSLHRICSREDYPASALHEVAHWCLAGASRRQLPDFGYWYAGDGRDQRQQRAFQQVEVKPQALEWAFSRAVGLRFQVSIDNLDGEPLDSFGFQLAVWQQARHYWQRGLPERAERFARALARAFRQAPRCPELAELCATVGGDGA